MSGNNPEQRSDRPDARTLLDLVRPTVDSHPSCMLDDGNLDEKSSHLAPHDNETLCAPCIVCELHGDVHDCGLKVQTKCTIEG
jgi:hypothetical protein